MSSSDFQKRLDFGKEGQDILINILEKHFGYSFIAGERYGNIENVEFIEEMENCEFIPPVSGTWNRKPEGAKLKFTDNDGNIVKLTMPDVFMENRNQKLYWIEVKRHFNDSDSLIIDFENFNDYCELYKRTRNNFYVMCMNPVNDEILDVYYCDFLSLITHNHTISVINKNSVCVWKISETMTKLNRYPLKIEKYRK